MNKFLAKLSIRSLSYLSVAIPLTGLVILSGQQVWGSYENYTKLNSALMVQKLAYAGGELAQALPGEAFSPPEQLEAARKRTDAAYEAVLAADRQASEGGIKDETVAKNIGFITANWNRLKAYRDGIDAAKGVVTPELRGTAIHLQPVSAAGIDLTRRAGAVIEDLELSRLIQGYYALMQINDAGLIEMGFGEQYLKDGAINAVQQSFLIHSRSLFGSYTNPVFEFLPSDFTKPYGAFLASEDNKFMQGVRDRMYSLAPNDKVDPEAAGRWMRASLDRLGMLTNMLHQSGELLQAKAGERLQEARLTMLFYGGLTLGAVLVSIIFSLLCIAGISGPLRQIVRRMTGLAEGDTQSAVPYEERKDEIGEMSHAVSYFRKAEIEKNRLQEEAEGIRTNAERQRIEDQRRAEGEADRRLTETTSALAGGLKRLASGDMQCEIHESFAPQFEALRQDFNTSVQQLRDALASVGTLAVEVDNGSSEISSASSDLSRRTEQQAASLEETAAALEEITANVAATTKRTSEARNVVQQARSRADKSSEVVTNAVAAMQKIEESSRQINQIIGVIDEIAFQTNLLALNAGVEAARAGEAGKGFAVVAQEVRELAQRSAGAAKEIKQLISNSAVAVNEGVKLVNDTGEGLTEIDQLVRVMNDHMDAIATAAQEQSTGLAEVNVAVNHMDQATQQNAAMVEEMNAAGVGLASESAKLRELLTRFQIGTNAQPLRQVASAMRKAASVERSPRIEPPAPRRVAAAAVSAAPSAGNWEEF
jgi:methyl-accepting chemotaxis protein